MTKIIFYESTKTAYVVQRLFTEEYDILNPKGAVERFNQTIQYMITKTAKTKKLEWDEVIDLCLDVYNSTFHISIESTPSEVLHGRSIRFPLPVVPEVLEKIKE